MDPFTLITIGTGLVGGIGNLIGSQQRAEAERKKMERAQELLGRSIIDQGELDTLLSTNTRRFNANLQRVLNTTALRSRGIENSGVIGAAASGEIAGQAALAESQIRSNVLQHNDSIYTKMASLQEAMPTPDSPFESFISGGISGAMAGMEITKGIVGATKLAGLDIGMLSKDVTNATGLTGSGAAHNTGVVWDEYSKNMWDEYIGGKR